MRRPSKETVKHCSKTANAVGISINSGMPFQSLLKIPHGPLPAFRHAPMIALICPVPLPSERNFQESSGLLLCLHLQTERVRTANSS